MNRILSVLLLLLTPRVFALTTTGSVFSTASEPIAGARVTARRAESTAERRTRVAANAERATLASAVTSDDGSFTIDSKAAGVIELFIEREGYAPAVERVLSGDTDLVFTLAAAAPRNGHVTAGGKPVSNALVLAMNGSTTIWSTRTDERGVYTIADPKGWCDSLTVLHPEYAPFVAETKAGVLPLDAALEPGRTIIGMVVGAGGRPIAKARLLAGPWQESVAADDGTFTLRHVASATKTIAAVDGSMFGSAAIREKDFVITLAAGRSISGTVRDAQKRPLAGAAVMAWTRAARDWKSVDVTVTDDKGNYELAHLDAAQYSVFAAASDALTFEATNAMLRDTASARADFTAKASAYLTGTVVDERRKPIAGAAVQYTMSGMPIVYGFTSNARSPTAQSGANGKFRLPLGPVESDNVDFRLQAIHAGFAAGISEPFRASRDTKPLTITLPDGIAFSGIVHDAEDKPVKGAAIAFVQDPFGAAVMPIDGALASMTLRGFVLSDANGTFTLHINDTNHDIGVWKEGFAGFRKGGVRPASAPLAITLEPGVEIRGRVTRKGSTAPIGGMIVARSEEASFATAAIAEDGTFALRSIRPGNYMLSYSAEDETSDSGPQKPVKAPASDVVFELPAVGEVRGRVIDQATRKPIDDYMVWGQSEEGGMSSGTVNDDGSFTLQVQSGPTKVSVRAEGFVSAESAVDVEVGKTKEITVALSAGRSITGRVTSEDHAAIEGATISIDSESESFQSAESDANGEFTLGGVQREAVKLNVSAERFVARAIDVDAGTSDARIDVVLLRGRKAFGRVLTSEGLPVEGAKVWAYDESSGHATSEADGTFVIEGLSGDRFSFRATRSDLGEATVENADIASEVVLRMRPATGKGSVHGRVKGFTEGSWMYGAVSAGDAGMSPIGRDGTFRIENVRAGEIELQAMAMAMRADVSSAPLTVTVTPDGDIEANPVLRTDISVRGTVYESGKPAPGRRVRFSGTASASATTSAEGVYELAAIEPGVYDVSVDGGRRYETRHTVNGSGTFDIHIDFSEIRGRVIDDKGAPLAGVKIEASAAEGASSGGETQTDASGAFLLSVARGTYIVTATKTDYATSAQRVEPDMHTVTLTMTPSAGLRVRLVDARNGRTLDGYVVATDAAGMHLARLHDAQSDGSIVVPVGTGSYRISASAGGYATQSVRTSVPHQGELTIALTPGGTLVIRADRVSGDLVKLVLPNGDEYVRCECNGIAEIRLTGLATTIENVTPGSYTMHVLDERGRIKSSYPVAIAEGQTTTADIHVPE